jgi:hypothetical protein
MAIRHVKGMCLERDEYPHLGRIWSDISRGYITIYAWLLRSLSRFSRFWGVISAQSNHLLTPFIFGQFSSR